MSDNQNTGSMGDQIKGALSEALQSGDFSNLNELVSQSVVNALNEVGRHISFVDGSEAQDAPEHTASCENKANTAAGKDDFLWQQTKEKMAKEKARQQQNWQEYVRRTQQQARGQMRQMQHKMKTVHLQNTRMDAASDRKNAIASPSGTSKASPVTFNRVGRVSNVLYQVFGGIGLGVTILITFLHFTLLISNVPASPAAWIVNILFLALFMGMIRLGAGQHRRLKLAERYVGLCGRNLYSEIEHLAKSTGRKTQRVIRDLRKMIRLGMFPQGHLDEQKTCFMLSDGIYRQYLETENNRRLREAADQKEAAQKPPEQEERQKQAASEAASDPSEHESELNAMVAEGMECIRKLRLLNDKIPGEVISAKLYRLESLLKDIFDGVKEHPEQMHRMHKLMSYYLPTTLKLVEAYEEFDRVKTPGDDILAAKAEIENTLDTINQAFTELLNNLFQDAVLDATTDAQVLKTMLAREGLMNDMSFKNDKENNGGK